MIRRRSWQSITLSLFLLALASLACSLGTASDDGTENIETKPLVLLLAPVNGSVFAEGVQVQFHAIVQDSLAGVARVEFRVDDFPVGEVTAADPNGQPSLDAQIAWEASDTRGHLVTVEAFRADASSLGLYDIEIKVTDRPVAQVLDDGGSAAPSPAGSQAETPPTPTRAPQVDMGILSGPIARANQDGLNVRQGPGTNYPVVGILNQGEQAQIMGRNADSSWWAIAFGDGTAWVISSLITTQGDVSQVPLVTAP